MSKYKENVGPYDGFTVNNAALLLIDHQVGLMQLIRDMTREKFKNNVVGLAKTAKISIFRNYYHKYGLGT
jgi:hypothetical protein